MTDAPSTTLSGQPNPTVWAQLTLRRQVERLDDLAELGLEMARAIQRRVADDQTASTAEAAMAFSRAARVVRMCGLLQARLIKDMEDAHRRSLIFAPRAEEEARLAAARERADADPANDHKARVERIVERQVKARHGGDDEEVERLMTEAAERLDDDDIYRDVLARPVGELVALICRDLGIDPDWERLSQEAWAIDEIESGAEGSPFLGREAAREERLRHQAHQGQEKPPRAPRTKMAGGSVLGIPVSLVSSW